MKVSSSDQRLARRARRAAIAMALAIVLSAVFPFEQAFAQDGGGSTGALPAPPLLAPFSSIGSAEARVVEKAPALSSLTPQVGPLIKQYYADVIDRRTTAFFPTNLDSLTHIDMPDTDEHWVRVDLSEQTLVAYSGPTPIRAFRVSTGLPNTPTVTGEFHIRAKVRTQLMEGGSRASDNYYNLPDVQWVQYFYEDYGLHGAYWHNDFGRPKSHGCVNMTNADAHWLWDFLGPVWDGSAWQQSTAENPGSLVIVTE
jgi:lipoprotein-anchoring transpeptidase ErfK/SrfK